VATESVPVEDVPPDRIPEPSDRISEGVVADPDPAERAFADEVEAQLAEPTRSDVELSAFAPARVLGSAAVENARTQLGVHEEPPGTNCGPPHERYVVWIAGRGTRCVPWCAYFVGWAFDTSSAGDHNHKAPWGNSGYVPYIYEWCRSHGKLVSTPAHGDVFLLNPTDPVHSHMGLVAGADPKKGLIYTCEGNWSDRVLSQLRNYHQGAYAFARL
jgi:hypothetical protein